MSILSTENQQYEKLQEQIQQLSQKWADTVMDDELITTVQSTVNSIPLIPQLNISVNIEQYHSFIKELLSFLAHEQPALSNDCEMLEQSLTAENIQEWFQSTVKINSYYFEEYAQKLAISEWLPFFVAEHAARPFLQKLALKHKEELDQADHHHGCPACGEPARFAVVSKKGKKELTCPRCDYAWQEKKISCAHCGTEDHNQLEILKLEGQESAQIHVCHSCKGYTKVIDVRKMIKKESPQILDIKTIHLDIIAQENGYGIPTKVITH